MFNLSVAPSPKMKHIHPNKFFMHFKLLKHPIDHTMQYFIKELESLILYDQYEYITKLVKPYL